MSNPPSRRTSGIPRLSGAGDAAQTPTIPHLAQFSATKNTSSSAPKAAQHVASPDDVDHLEPMDDLLASDASEELLELELRATTPLQGSHLSGQNQLADEQLRALYQQVEHLQAQVQKQNAEQEALKIEVSLQTSQLRERLTHATQEANDASAAASAGMSQLELATDALQQLHEAVTQLTAAGSADAGSLHDLIMQINDTSSCISSAMDHVESTAAKHTAIIHACDEDMVPSTPAAAASGAEIARLQDELATVRQREQSLQEQLSTAHDVFRVLEREVSALQQQQVTAITRLRKSQEEAAEVCEQLQSVVDTLRHHSKSQPTLSATCATVQQSVVFMENQAKAIRAYLDEVDSTEGTSTTTGAEHDHKQAVTTAAAPAPDVASTSLADWPQGAAEAGLRPSNHSGNSPAPAVYSPPMRGAPDAPLEEEDSHASTDPLSFSDHSLEMIEHDERSSRASANGARLASRNSHVSQSQGVRAQLHTPLKSEHSPRIKEDQISHYENPIFDSHSFPSATAVEPLVLNKPPAPSASKGATEGGASATARLTTRQSQIPLPPSVVPPPLPRPSDSGGASLSPVSPMLPPPSPIAMPEGGSLHSSLDLGSSGVMPSMRTTYEDSIVGSVPQHAGAPPPVYHQELEKLHAANAQLQEELNGLRAQLMQLKRSAADSAAEADAMVRAAASAEQEELERERHVGKALAAELEAHKGQVALLQADLERVRASHGLEVLDLQASYTALKADYDAATATWERLQAHKQWMTQEIAGLQRELREADGRARSAGARLAELQTQLRTAEAEVASLSSKLASAQAARSEAEASASNFGQRLAELSRREREQRAALADREAEVSDLLQKLAAPKQHAISSMGGMAGMDHTAIMAETMLLHKNIANLERQFDKAVDAVASAAMMAAMAELKAEGKHGYGTLHRSSSPAPPALARPQLLSLSSFDNRSVASDTASAISPAGPLKGTGATLRASLARMSAGSDSQPPAPPKLSQTGGIKLQPAAAPVRPPVPVSWLGHRSDPAGAAAAEYKSQDLLPSPQHTPSVGIPSPAGGGSVHGGDAYGSTEQDLRVQLSELQGKLEVERLRASNALLHRRVAEMELVSVKEKVKEMEGTARDLRVHIQDLQMQVGMKRSISLRSAGGSLENTNNSSSVQSNQAQQISEIGAAIMAATTPSSGGSPIRGVLTSRISPTSTLSAMTNSGSQSVLAQQQVTAITASHSTITTELKQLLVSELQPLQRRALELEQQVATAVAARRSMSAFVANAIHLSETAVQQVDHHMAAAFAAEKELHRSRQAYKDSHSMLQTLYDEAQRLNQQLWAHNSELSDANDVLEAQVAALHGGRAPTQRHEDSTEYSEDFEDSGELGDMVGALGATRSQPLHGRDASTSMAGAPAELRQTSKNDRGTSVGGATGAGGEHIQLRAGLAASQRQVQQLQQLLFDRNKLITELESQLMAVSDDIKTFEATVIRVEAVDYLRNLLSPSKASRHAATPAALHAAAPILVLPQATPASAIRSNPLFREGSISPGMSPAQRPGGFANNSSLRASESSITAAARSFAAALASTAPVQGTPGIHGDTATSAPLYGADAALEYLQLDVEALRTQLRERDAQILVLQRQIPPSSTPRPSRPLAGTQAIAETPGGQSIANPLFQDSPSARAGSTDLEHEMHTPVQRGLLDGQEAVSLRRNALFDDQASQASVGTATVTPLHGLATSRLSAGQSLLDQSAVGAAPQEQSDAVQQLLQRNIDLQHQLTEYQQLMASHSRRGTRDTTGVGSSAGDGNSSGLESISEPSRQMVMMLQARLAEAHHELSDREQQIQQLAVQVSNSHLALSSPSPDAHAPRRPMRSSSNHGGSPLSPNTSDNGRIDVPDDVARAYLAAAGIPSNVGYESEPHTPARRGVDMQQALQEQVQTALAEVASLQSELADTKELLSSSQMLVHSKEAQLLSMQEQLQASQAQLSSTQHEVQASNTQLQDMQKQVHASEARLQSLQEELQASAGRVRSTEEQLQESEARTKGLQEELLATQAQLRGAQKELARVQQELEDALDSRQELLQQAEVYAADVVRYQKQLEELGRQREVAEEELSSLQQLLAAQQQQLDELQSSASEARQASVAIASQLQDAEQEAAKARTRANTLEADLAKALADVAHHIMLTSRLRLEAEESSQRTQALQGDLDAVRQEHVTTQERAATQMHATEVAAASELVAAREEVQRAQQEAAAARTDLAQAEDQLAQQLAQAEEQTAQLHVLKLQLEQFEVRMKEASCEEASRIQAAEHGLAAQELTSASLQSRLVVAEQQLREAAAARDAALEAGEQLREAHEELQAQFMVVVAEKEAAEEQLVLAQQALTVLREQSQALAAQHADDEAGARELVRSASMMQRERDELLAASSEQITELQQECVQLQALLSRQQVELEDAAAQYEAAQRQVEVLHGQREQLAARVMQLESAQEAAAAAAVAAAAQQAPETVGAGMSQGSATSADLEIANLLAGLKFLEANNTELAEECDTLRAQLRSSESNVNLELGKLRAQLLAKDEAIRQLRSNPGNTSIPGLDTPLSTGSIAPAAGLSEGAAAATAAVAAAMSSGGIEWGTWHSSVSSAVQRSTRLAGSRTADAVLRFLDPQNVDLSPGAEGEDASMFSKIEELEDELHHHRNSTDVQLGALASTNAKLIVQIEALIADLDAAEKEIEALRAKVAQLEEQVTAQHQRAENARTRADSAQVLMEDAQESRAAADGEVHQARERLAAAEAEAQRLQSELAVAAGMADQQQEQVAHMATELADMRAQLVARLSGTGTSADSSGSSKYKQSVEPTSILQQRMDVQVGQQLSELDAAITELLAHLKHLSTHQSSAPHSSQPVAAAAGDSVEQRMRSLVAAVHALTDSLTGAQEAAEDAQAEKEVAEQLLQSAHIQLAGANAALDAANELVAAAQHKQRALAAELEELQATTQAKAEEAAAKSTKRIQDLEQQLDEVQAGVIDRGKAERLMGQVRELQDEVAELEETLERAGQQVDELTAQAGALEQDLRAAGEKIGALEDALTAAQERETNLQEELAEAQERVAGLEHEVMQGREQLAVLEAQAGEAAATRSAMLQAELNEVREELVSKEAALLATTQQLAAMEEEVDVARHTASMLDTELGEVRKGMELQAGAAAQLQGELQEAVWAEARAREELQEHKDINDHAAEKVVVLEEGLAEARAQVEAFASSFTNLQQDLAAQQGSHEHVVAQLEAELQAARAALDQQMSNVVSERRALEAQVNALQTELITLRSAAQQGGDMCLHLTDQVSSLAGQVAAQADALVAAEDTIRELRGRISLLEYQLAAAHAMLADVDERLGSPQQDQGGDTVAHASNGVQIEQEVVPYAHSGAPAAPQAGQPSGSGTSATGDVTGPKAPRGVLRQAYAHMAQVQVPPARGRTLSSAGMRLIAKIDSRAAARVPSGSRSRSPGPGRTAGAGTQSTSRAISAPPRRPAAAAAAPRSKSPGPATSAAPGAAGGGSGPVQMPDLASLKRDVLSTKAAIADRINRIREVQAEAGPVSSNNPASSLAPPQQRAVESLRQELKVLQAHLLSLLEQIRSITRSPATSPAPTAREAAGGAQPVQQAASSSRSGAASGAQQPGLLTTSMTSLISMTAGDSRAWATPPSQQHTTAHSTLTLTHSRPGTGRSQVAGSRYSGAGRPASPNPLAIHRTPSAGHSVLASTSTRLHALMGITPPPATGQASTARHDANEAGTQGEGERTPRGGDTARPRSASAFIPPTPGVRQGLASAAAAAASAQQRAGSQLRHRHINAEQQQVLLEHELGTSPMIDMESMADPAELPSARKPVGRGVGAAAAPQQPRRIVQAAANRQVQRHVVPAPKQRPAVAQSSGLLAQLAAVGLTDPSSPSPAMGPSILDRAFSDAAAAPGALGTSEPHAAASAPRARSAALPTSPSPKHMRPPSRKGSGEPTSSGSRAGGGAQPTSEGAAGTNSLGSYGSYGAPARSPSSASSRSPPWRPPGPLGHSPAVLQAGATGAVPGALASPLEQRTGNRSPGDEASPPDERQHGLRGVAVQHEGKVLFQSPGRAMQTSPVPPTPYSPFLALPAAQLLSLYPAARTLGVGAAPTAASVHMVARSVKKNARDGSVPSPSAVRAAGGSEATQLSRRSSHASDALATGGNSEGGTAGSRQSHARSSSGIRTPPLAAAIGREAADAELLEAEARMAHGAAAFHGDTAEGWDADDGAVSVSAPAMMGTDVAAPGLTGPTPTPSAPFLTASGMTSRASQAELSEGEGACVRVSGVGAGSLLSQLQAHQAASALAAVQHAQQYEAGDDVDAQRTKRPRATRSGGGGDVPMQPARVSQGGSAQSGQRTAVTGGAVESGGWGAEHSIRERAYSHGGNSTWASRPVPGEVGVNTAAALMGSPGVKLHRTSSGTRVVGPAYGADDATRPARRVSSPGPEGQVHEPPRVPRASSGGASGGGMSGASLASLRVATAAAAAQATAAVMLAAANIKASGLGVKAVAVGGHRRMSHGGNSSAAADAGTSSVAALTGPNTSVAAVSGSGASIAPPPPRARSPGAGGARAHSPGARAGSPGAGRRSGSPSGGRLYLSSGVAGVPPQIIPTIVRDEEDDATAGGGRKPWRKA